MTEPAFTPERIREVCYWFKPIWYGTADDFGHKKLTTRADSGDPIILTDAARPDNWIETVARFLDAGLPQSAIHAAVITTMAAPISHEARWRHFIGCCAEELRALRGVIRSTGVDI